MSTKTPHQNARSNAFPQIFECYAPEFGLTKRELFAAMAMQGLAEKNGAAPKAAWIAKTAVGIADALLAALADEGEKEADA